MRGTGPSRSPDYVPERPGGVVYFVHDPRARLVKIGWSQEPTKRIAAICSNGRSLHLLGIIPAAGKSTERTVHQELAHLRVEGEWFRATDYLAEFMRVRCVDLKWPMLVSRVPRLEPLLAEARAVDGTPETFCANAYWYGYGKYRGRPALRDRVSALVGWGSESNDEWVRSSEAYHIAYQTVYHALPACRDCICIGGEKWEKATAGLGIHQLRIMPATNRKAGRQPALGEASA